jgi:hypothetical protein
MTRHCPECYSEFQDWVMTCLDCGTPTQEGTAPAKKPEDKSKRLEELNWQNADEESIEEEAGEDFEDSEDEEEETDGQSSPPADPSVIRCPKCGSEYQSWAKKCLDCGSFLKAGASQGDSEDNAAAENVEKKEPGSKVPINVSYKGKLIPVAVFNINHDVDIKDLVTGMEADIKKNLLNAEGIRVYQNKTTYYSREFLEFYVETEQAAEAKKILADYDQLQTEEKAKSGSESPTATGETTRDLEENTSPEPLGNQPSIEPGLREIPGNNPGEPLKVIKSALPQNPTAHPLPLKYEETHEIEEEKKVKCLNCNSTDLEVHSALFSNQITLKCRQCGSKQKA